MDKWSRFAFVLEDRGVFMVRESKIFRFDLVEVLEDSSLSGGNYDLINREYLHDNKGK